LKAENIQYCIEACIGIVDIRAYTGVWSSNGPVDLALIPACRRRAGVRPATRNRQNSRLECKKERSFDFVGEPLAQFTGSGDFMTAQYQVSGDVAVITMDNPPVNGLGFETRMAVAKGLDAAQADPVVKAIVLTGAGKAFSAAGPTSKSSARPRLWPNPIC
jgi:hypothetical protein